MSVGLRDRSHYLYSKNETLEIGFLARDRQTPEGVQPTHLISKSGRSTCGSHWLWIMAAYALMAEASVTGLISTDVPTLYNTRRA